MADVPPPELGELLRNAFYKQYAPPALQSLGIRQQYQICARTVEVAVGMASTPTASTLRPINTSHTFLRRRGFSFDAI